MRNEEDNYSILDWWKKVIFSNYVNFRGRARRAEYWYFILMHYGIIIGLSLLTAVLSALTNNSELASIPSLLSGFYVLGTLLPILAVSVRRLHDTGKSGWWLLAPAIPLVGGIIAIVLLVFFCTDGDTFDNEYGPDPKNRGGSFNYSGGYSILNSPDKPDEPKNY